MNGKNLLESVSEAVNGGLPLRDAYLAVENRILRHQIDGGVLLTDRKRTERAEMDAKVGQASLGKDWHDGPG